jgi:hypothetical protein
MSVDGAEMERPWNERGFSCELWIEPPGEVGEDYLHATDDLVMVVDGEFEIDGQVHDPSAGEKLFISARARRTVRNLGCGESCCQNGYRR